MANEAVIIELYGDPKGEPIRYKCGIGDSIEKGTLLKFSGAGVREVCKTVAADRSSWFAGIAAEEKVAADTSQNYIGVWTKGIFDLKCNASPSGVPGQYVVVSGANMISIDAINASSTSGAQIVGVLMEPISTDNSTDTVAVMLGRG